MNSINLVGRLTKEPIIRETTSQSKVSTISIAVRRPFQNENKEYDTDFFDIVSYGATAEFVSKYCHKGNMISVHGSLLTQKYTNKQGVNVTRYYIMSNSIDLI